MKSKENKRLEKALRNWKEANKKQKQVITTVNIDDLNKSMLDQLQAMK